MPSIGVNYQWSRSPKEGPLFIYLFIYLSIHFFHISLVTILHTCVAKFGDVQNMKVENFKHLFYIVGKFGIFGDFESKNFILW
jgi:hypothetical protein